MNKKLIFSLIVVLILVVIGIFIFEFQSPVLDNPISSQGSNNKQNQQVIRDPLEYIGDCDTKGSQLEKETCWMQRAALSKDIEICKNQFSGDTVENCIIEVAINSRDPQLCNDLSDPEDCKGLYALNVLDQHYCKEETRCNEIIGNWNNKYKLQLDDCQQLTQLARSSGFSGGNDYTLKQDCLSYLAKLEKEPSYCSEITFDSTRERCEDFANQQTSYEACSTKMGYGNPRDGCYYRLSKQENDRSYCNFIELDVLKNRCNNN